MWSDKDLWTCPDLPEPLWPLRATEPELVIYGHIWSHGHIEQSFIVSLFKSDENSVKYKIKEGALGTCIPRQESVLSARQPAGLLISKQGTDAKYTNSRWICSAGFKMWSTVNKLWSWETTHLLCLKFPSENWKEKFIFKTNTKMKVILQSAILPKTLNSSGFNCRSMQNSSIPSDSMKSSLASLYFSKRATILASEYDLDSERTICWLQPLLQTSKW